jgi:peptidyl-prolyl cis-trans isomerase SurA
MNRLFFKALPLAVSILISTTILSSTLNAGHLVDRVVAVVNDDVITMSDVNSEGRSYFKKINEQAPPAQVEDALARAREEVLNTLIDKKLIAQEAVIRNVSVSDTEVEAAAQQMILNNKITKKMLQEQLAQMGMSYESYLETLRNQILQSKLVNYEIRSRIIITDDMILDYYDTNYTKHVSEGGYYLMQMGFSWGQPGGDTSVPAQYADKMDAKKRAERVRALVIGGQNFRDLAKKFSDLPSASDGGDIGVFQKEDMAPYMQDAILGLKPGGVSDVIETPSGYQFFKLLSSNDGQIVVQASFASVKEEIRKKLYDEELKNNFDTWVKNIKDKAYIKKL